MGKAAEMLKDKGGVVSSFPADALHDTVCTAVLLPRHSAGPSW